MVGVDPVDEHIEYKDMQSRNITCKSDQANGILHKSSAEMDINIQENLALDPSTHQQLDQKFSTINTGKPAEGKANDSKTHDSKAPEAKTFNGKRTSNENSKQLACDTSKVHLAQVREAQAQAIKKQSQKLAK